MIFVSRPKQATSRVAALGALAILACQMAPGQQAQQTHSPSAAAPTSPANNCAPMNWTAEQDHQNMLDQLEIKALRPGPSGNEKASDHANYDESKANPFPRSEEHTSELK